MVRRMINEIPTRKNPAAVALGKLGAKKGGLARAAQLSPERRSEIARMGGANSWKNRIYEGGQNMSHSGGRLVLPSAI